MQLKSIQNTGLVNLQNCDSEPIHVPGSIQPHGYLFVLDNKNQIQFCSNNLKGLGLNAANVLGKTIAAVLTKPEEKRLSAYIQQGEKAWTKPLTLQHKNKSYTAAIHRSNKWRILELELTNNEPELNDLYQQTRRFTATLSRVSSLQQLCQTVAEEIKTTTGYDRVMIYRFDEQYNGEVFAEALNKRLEPFLGLHYPHTDIPVQARQLYLKNQLRLISDVNYKPVPLVTLNPKAANTSVDLGNAMLRSVSPIHCQYLQNMGVGATLTVSLILEGKLWGLVACHHYSPRIIPYHARLSALLQAHFLTSQIRVLEVSEEFAAKQKLDAKLNVFLETLKNKTLKREKEIPRKELLEVVNADGVCLFMGHLHYCYGNVPTDARNKLLYQKTANRGDIYYTDNIERDLQVKTHKQIAGLLSYRVDNDVTIIWYRNELKEVIKWAGNPKKAIKKNADGLSPRKSFAAWKEVIAGFSRPWQAFELTVAAQCIYAIQKAVAVLKARRIDKTQRELLKQLKQANSELENLNWISTHDLKEPLRKIAIFSSLLLDEDKYKLHPNAASLVNRVSNSATRMRHLIDDLMLFNKIKAGEVVFEPCNLNSILQEVADEYRDEAHTINLKANTLPPVNGVPLLLHQLFANLVGNAIKFSKEAVAPRIVITSSVQRVDGKAYVRITVADNGIGFDSAYSELIFKVFQRLDKAEHFQGTGIGLAICKNIVDKHRGKITAEGKPDKGATFTVLLPVK